MPEILSIRNVLDLSAMISSQIENRDQVILEISPGAEADLSFVQLVESARRQAKLQGKSLTLAAPVGERILKVLERAGFVEAFTAEDTKFWLHEEVTA